MIAVSIIMFGLFFMQGAGKTYNVADLASNATIDVTDDKYYGADHTEDPIQYEMTIPTSGPHNPHDIKFGFTLTSRATITWYTIWSTGISSSIIVRTQARI